jgi:glycerophosphoryl diester phosphodiesterase
MELILHRVNTLDRLDEAAAAGVDRAEVDVHWHRGRLLVTHDPPLGPFALGPNGVQFSRWPLPMPHWQGRFLGLEDVLDRAKIPLFLDLKGPWTEAPFGRLHETLRERGRRDDLIASNRWTVLARCRAVDPPRRFVYGLPRRAVSMFRLRLEEPPLPFGVSVRPALAANTDLMESLRKNGVAVFVWDIRDRGLLQELSATGFTGAIFDDPAWAGRDPHRLD